MAALVALGDSAERDLRIVEASTAEPDLDLRIGDARRVALLRGARSCRARGNAERQQEHSRMIAYFHLYIPTMRSRPGRARSFN
jgi:hypothetical protein